MNAEFVGASLAFVIGVVVMAYFLGRRSRDDDRPPPFLDPKLPLLYTPIPPPPARPTRMLVVIGVVTTVFLAALAITILDGCAGWGGKSCAVIDIAHDACSVVRYLETDGTERDVRLTHEEATWMARASARRQGLVRDGGAD